MHIVIAGAGSVGLQIAKQLIDEKHDVVLVEEDEERAKQISASLDLLVIPGSASSLTNLLKAGIVKADFYISVTDSDEINMVSAGIVSTLFTVPKLIARIRNPEYYNNSVILNKFLHVDYVVNPEIEATREIIDITDHGALTHVITFKKTNVHLVNLEIAEESQLVGKTLKEIRASIDKTFLVAAISRDDKLLIPDGDTLIKAFDNIYIQATDGGIGKIFAESGKSHNALKKILIVGGTRLGGRVLSNLLKKNYSVTLIDKDYKVCKRLSTDYPNALILHADITDEHIYEEERIDSYDLIICLTNNEELNVLTALYAKKIGTKRTIALVMNNNYLKLSHQLGIDSVISPKSSSVDSILKYMRKGNISSVKSIFYGKAEVLEFVIDGANKLIGKKLKEIKMPSQSLLLSINREGSKILPVGDFTFEDGDAVLVIAQKSLISKIENIFYQRDAKKEK